MNISDIVTPHTFQGLTKKQRAILNTWYDNNCEGSPFVSDTVGCSTSMVMKTVNSELGKKYLEWRLRQDGVGSVIDKTKIIEEYKALAFANADDCYEVVRDEEAHYNSSTGEHESGLVYQPKNFAKISKRERKRIKAGVSEEHGKWGKKFTVNMKAKMDALDKLTQISELLSPEKEESRSERSGNAILDKIKKLSKLKKAKESQDDGIDETGE